MTVQTIPDIEDLIGDWLRNHSFLASLAPKVSGALPRKEADQAHPWVKVTQLDASDVGGKEHLIDYLVQFDCYAGADATRDFVGQGEASTLARQVRAALKDAQGQILASTAVITGVYFTGMARVPDTDFEPARQRFTISSTIYAHSA